MSDFGKTVVTRAVWGTVIVILIALALAAISHIATIVRWAGGFLLWGLPAWFAYDVVHFLPLALFLGAIGMIAYVTYTNKSMLVKGLCVLGIIVICVLFGPTMFHSSRFAFGPLHQAANPCGNVETKILPAGSITVVNPKGSCFFVSEILEGSLQYLDENKAPIEFKVVGRPTIVRVAHDHVDADVRSTDVVYLLALQNSKVKQMTCPRANYSGWNCL